MSINHNKLGASLVNLCNRRAYENKSKLVPDTAFYYAELAALGTLLGRVVTSGKTGRGMSSHQNYLLMFPKGVGKNSMVEAAEIRIEQLVSRCNIYEQPIELNETATPESLAASLGYYKTFDANAEAKKIEADADKNGQLLTQLDIDKEVVKREINWKTDADNWLSSRRMSAIWYSRESSTTLSQLIGGARSEQEIGAKIGWALSAFDPFGIVDSSRIGSGKRYVRQTCLSSIWATQPKTFLSSFDIETLRFTGFFERMIPVINCEHVPDMVIDDALAEDCDNRIELLHQHDRRVKITFDNLPDTLDEIQAWEKSLPVIKECLALDYEWADESLSKWYGLAQRIAQLRAFMEKVTVSDIKGSAPIRVDATEFIGDALEWVAQHYLGQLKQEIFAEIDPTFTKFMSRLNAYVSAYYSDDHTERESVSDILHVNEAEGKALFNRRAVLSRFSVKGLNYNQKSKLLEDWAKSRAISLEDARPDIDRWNRKQPFIVIGLGRLKRGDQI